MVCRKLWIVVSFFLLKFSMKVRKVSVFVVVNNVSSLIVIEVLIGMIDSIVFISILFRCLFSLKFCVYLVGGVSDVV